MAGSRNIVSKLEELKIKEENADQREMAESDMISKLDGLKNRLIAMDVDDPGYPDARIFRDRLLERIDARRQAFIRLEEFETGGLCFVNAAAAKNHKDLQEKAGGKAIFPIVAALVEDVNRFSKNFKEYKRFAKTHLENRD